MSDSPESSPPRQDPPIQLVNVRQLAQQKGQETTCLRPLGLCELSGSCDVCWYRPDHPRFRNP
jgi:hypothetical protein